MSHTFPTSTHDFAIFGRDVWNDRRDVDVRVDVCVDVDVHVDVRMCRHVQGVDAT